MDWVSGGGVYLADLFLMALFSVATILGDGPRGIGAGREGLFDESAEDFLIYLSELFDWMGPRMNGVVERVCCSHGFSSLFVNFSSALITFSQFSSFDCF